MRFWHVLLLLSVVGLVLVSFTKCDPKIEDEEDEAEEDDEDGRVEVEDDEPVVEETPREKVKIGCT